MSQAVYQASSTFRLQDSEQSQAVASSLLIHSLYELEQVLDLFSWVRFLCALASAGFTSASFASPCLIAFEELGSSSVFILLGTYQNYQMNSDKPRMPRFQKLHSPHHLFVTRFRHIPSLNLIGHPPSFLAQCVEL